MKVAEYLDICGRNNIVMNLSKFQFCQDTIDFSGFKVFPTNLMPSDKMLESIRNFPSPTDISGACAWLDWSTRWHLLLPPAQPSTSLNGPQVGTCLAKDYSGKGVRFLPVFLQSPKLFPRRLVCVFEGKQILA